MSSKEMKYVITKTNKPVLFSKASTHTDFGSKDTIESAGFCKIYIDTYTNRMSVDCYGESVSLGLKSSEDDKIIIECMLNESRITRTDSYAVL